MKSIVFEGTEFLAEKITKSACEITGYIDNMIAFKFSGLEDTDSFILEKEAEFDKIDISSPKRIEILEQENERLKEMIADLYELQLLG